MKKLIISTLFVMQTVLVLAQTGVTGKVVDSKSQRPLQNVEVSVQNSNVTGITDALGVFTLEVADAGERTVHIRTSGYREQFLNVTIVKDQMVNLGSVVMEEDITSELELSLITITENDLGDDNSGSESTAGLLQASRDTYQQAAAFNWGQARFRIRGLDNEYGTTMINGIVMNKINDGRPQWGNWGGLNDATRNQEFTMGLAPSDYTFGGILGTQEINTRASIYRPGTRISFAGTNTNYSYRMMGTHASGMNSDGWAYVISASRRWATEGYFEGTDYSANSVFASVEKKINDKHSLNFTSIFAQNERGRNSPNTDEVTSIAGIEYNSYWGWQDGKKRNARDRTVEEPILMLSHYWKMTDRTSLNTNVAYQTGFNASSRLDFNGVPNPDPTYYRNLPSYFTSLFNNNVDYVNQNDPTAYQPGGLGGIWTPNYLAATNPLDAKFLGQRQIDWESMYRANTTPIIVNGLEVGRAPGESRYIMYEDRIEDNLWSANTILNSQIADNIVMNAGVHVRKLKSHNFQYLTDLLGGAYFADYDTFGTGSQQQTDLNNPDRIVGEGDEFGYNYNMHATTIDGFTQFRFTYRDVDFYTAQTFSRNEYQREGLYRNGYYPNNSFGKSKSVVFENFGFKGGMTIKLTGQHMININGGYMTKAPNMRNVFPNARMSNNVMDIDNERIATGDISYILRMPRFKARVTGFIANMENATETSFFFAEGVFEDSESSDSDAFVAESVTNLKKRNIGAELGIEYQITSTLKAIASASYGQYTYANNPTVFLNQDALASVDNPNPLINMGESKMKNYHQPGTPQQAYSFGLEYRDPKFWWIGANVNYLDDNYLDISPILRTNNFVRNPADIAGGAFPEITKERMRELLKQEKFDPIRMVNLTGGKSWKIKKSTVGIFAMVNNLFNYTYKTGGYEQARNANYRELNQDAASGTPAFAPKYFYGYGRTYFANLYINF
jgi:hypothetical protein